MVTNVLLMGPFEKDLGRRFVQTMRYFQYGRIGEQGVASAI